MSSKAKSKKLKRRNKPRKLIIPKWKLFRANEPLLSVFMWGINHSVSELSHVPPPGLLLPDDFKAFSKIKIDNHLFNKENMPSHFKFKDYCPHVFRNLREKFGVDEQDYLKSLTKYEPEETTVSSRSQSKFYISYNHKFVVKNLYAEEVAEVHSILQSYYEYVVEKHGKTLLPQYLGLYRLTVEGAETYLMVMKNIFGRKYQIHKKFDLKGSTVQRQASDKEKMKELPTLKDNDFIDHGCKLYLPNEAKEKLISILTSDTAFLAKLHLMDYSLLVGIHDCGRQPETPPPGDVPAASSPPAGDSSEPDAGSLGSADFVGGHMTPPDSPVPLVGAFGPLKSDAELDLEDEFYAIPSRSDAPGKEIYYIGLVDILTYYGVKKRTASAAKSVKYGSDAENISTVKPLQYARRMVEFVTRTVADANDTT